MSVIDRIQRAPAQDIFSFAGRMVPWFAVAAVLLCASGLYIGFGLAPAGLRQGGDYHILFLHVPAACMTLIMYLVLAFWIVLGLVLRTGLSAMMASAVAPTGAMFAFLALWTGSLWGKSSSGAWWTWDALFVSELILLLLYLSIMVLQATARDMHKADKAVAVLTLAGMVNIPLIYYFHDWQSVAHLEVSYGLRGMPSTVSVMLLIMLGFWAYAFTTVLVRVRCIMLERERHMDWTTDYAKGRL